MASTFNAWAELTFGTQTLAVRCPSGQTTEITFRVKLKEFV